MSSIEPASETNTLSPMERWFAFLTRFDEVSLPDGRRFSLRNGGLFEQQGGAWEFSNISANELLNCLSGLSTEAWRDLLRNASGGEEARQWRERVLTFKLPRK